MRAGVERREVEVGGVRTRYPTTGEGPPLVLLHGTGTNAWEWDWTLPTLARGRSVYAPDLPGFGGRAPVADPSPEYFAAFVAAFLDGGFLDEQEPPDSNGQDPRQSRQMPANEKEEQKR